MSVPDEPRVIKAVFSDWRTVKSRSSLQLIFEIPLELQGEVLKMLGAPMPGESKWVAIALLDQEKLNGSVAQSVEQTAHNGQVVDSSSTASTKTKRKWDELSYPEQAGIRCADLEFQDWVLGPEPEHDEGAVLQNRLDRAAHAVRHFCQVTTRSEIKPGTKAEKLWLHLCADYDAFCVSKKYADIVR